MSFCPIKFKSICIAISSEERYLGDAQKIENHVKKYSKCEDKECGMYNCCKNGDRKINYP